MKKITTLILCFLIGFYGFSLFTNDSELLLFKAKFLFFGVILVTILNIIEILKNKLK